MPRAKKQAESQLVEQPVFVGVSIVPSERPKSSGAYRMAKDVLDALTDDDTERNGLQLPLFLETREREGKLGFKRDGIEITARKMGIRFETSNANKLFRLLNKKLSDTVEIKDGEARQIEPVVPDTSDLPAVTIRGRSYLAPCIDVTVYELVKDVIGNRKPSGRDYEEFWRSFEELKKTPHCFTMKVRTGRKDKNDKELVELIELYEPVIIHGHPDLTEDEATAIENEIDGLEGTDSSRSPRQRLRIYLHPITIHTAGRWWSMIPNDLEDFLTDVGASKSPYITQLALLVLNERGLPTTRRRGYFELGKTKFIGKLQLEKYRNRPSELKAKIDTAVKALQGRLIEKLDILPDRNGGIKYRIYPLFDPVKEIENGAA